MSLKQPVTLISQSLVQAGFCMPFMLITLIIYGISREGEDFGAAAMYMLFAIPGYVVAFASYIIFSIIEFKIKSRWQLVKHAVPLVLLAIGLLFIPSYKPNSQQVFFTIIISIILFDLGKMLYHRVLTTL
ncbi:hypothetical protein [Mucilaginibacter celer]|uniref:Uncharacterized protein n=1 Tax=Mucilaginibacter celer TaxID=2305508 RepID=A0A494VTF7_9SPHI|nr:hypothetical protein [Mucilaginibacter celer]AYL94678.1 hypothetical protein HYN43_004935 [Mucilaginibacter celer]